MENAGEFVGVTPALLLLLRWLIVLVNVERSTGGGPGAGAGLGRGQVFFSCNGEHVGRRFKQARRNTKPSNN